MNHDQQESINARVSSIFRKHFEMHPARYTDPALALSSARDEASEAVPAGVSGTFDDETLTFKVVAPVVSAAEKMFLATCEDSRLDPIEQEAAILSIDREFLPDFALAVLDDGRATDEYWLWLVDQLRSGGGAA